MHYATHPVDRLSKINKDMVDVLLVLAVLLTHKTLMLKICSVVLLRLRVKYMIYLLTFLLMPITPSEA